jgi:hypothetical protein
MLLGYFMASGCPFFIIMGSPRWYVSLFKQGWCPEERSRDSSVSIVSDTGLSTGRSRFVPWQGQRIFPLSSVSGPALGPTQLPVQWVPGVLSQGVKRDRGVTLTTYLHLVPRSWMSKNYSSSPPSASMACSGTALLTYFGIPKKCSQLSIVRHKLIAYMYWLRVKHT